MNGHLPPLLTWTTDDLGGQARCHLRNFLITKSVGWNCNIHGGGDFDYSSLSLVHLSYPEICTSPGPREDRPDAITRLQTQKEQGWEKSSVRINCLSSAAELFNIIQSLKPNLPPNIEFI